MAATTMFQQDDSRLQNPAFGAFSITPHDTNELTKVTKALHANADGTAVVTMAAGGTDVTLVLVKGMVYPYQIKAVKATGTTFTAGQLIGLV